MVGGVGSRVFLITSFTYLEECRTILLSISMMFPGGAAWRSLLNP